ncbi:MAG: ubiquinol-cytochrome c reductase cytochrome c1 subunit [Planctomycetota bacterium]|jgi:ubiquinol-cytochrome c reductase cytochrome c1 subunit
MIKKITLAALVSLGLATTGAHAAGGESHIENFAFSFEGPFGKFDQAQLQRGLQVYTEVCAACHGMQYVSFRNLGDHGGPQLEAGQVKAYAKLYDVFDAELDDTRPGKPADKFPDSVDPNAPDLSLMAKARAGFHGPYGLGINQLTKGMGGAEYIASILSGYTGHEKEEAGTVLYENTAFPGGWISMPPPLVDDVVEYADGHSADVHHMSADVSAFLMWAAEPQMMARKTMGLVAVFLLGLLTVLLYLTNKVIWAPIKRKDV